MSTSEEICQEAKRDAYYDKIEPLLPDEPCGCGMRQWFLVDTDVYGADADGNRGVPLRLWECKNCGNEVEMIYG